MKSRLMILAVLAAAVMCGGCFTPVGMRSYERSHALQIAAEQSPAGVMSVKAAIDLTKASSWWQYFKAEPAQATGNALLDGAIAGGVGILGYQAGKGFGWWGDNSSDSSQTTTTSSKADSHDENVTVNASGSGSVNVTVYKDSPDNSTR